MDTVCSRGIDCKGMGPRAVTSSTMKVRADSGCAVSQQAPTGCITEWLSRAGYREWRPTRPSDHGPHRLGNIPSMQPAVWLRLSNACMTRRPCVEIDRTRGNPEQDSRAPMSGIRAGSGAALIPMKYLISRIQSEMRRQRTRAREWVEQWVERTVWSAWAIVHMPEKMKDKHTHILAGGSWACYA